MKKVDAVLFDLDGTLLDTAPDLLFALNQLRLEKQMPPLSMEAIRHSISFGSKVMIKQVLGIEENDPEFQNLREKFLTHYENHIARSTQFFPQMENVLAHLDAAHIPWGIVTNKLTRHTHALLKALSFDHRPQCVICGDSLTTYKPDPAPILYACELLKKTPERCLYVGDSLTDVTASKAARTQTVVALYGYISPSENPRQWQADGYIERPIDMMAWLS